MYIKDWANREEGIKYRDYFVLFYNESSAVIFIPLCASFLIKVSKFHAKRWQQFVVEGPRVTRLLTN